MSFQTAADKRSRIYRRGMKIELTSLDLYLSDVWENFGLRDWNGLVLSWQPWTQNSDPDVGLAPLVQTRVEIFNGKLMNQALDSTIADYFNSDDWIGAPVEIYDYLDDGGTWRSEKAFVGVIKNVGGITGSSFSIVVEQDETLWNVVPPNQITKATYDNAPDDSLGMAIPRVLGDFVAADVPSAWLSDRKKLQRMAMVRGQKAPAVCYDKGGERITDTGVDYQGPRFYVNDKNSLDFPESSNQAEIFFWDPSLNDLVIADFGNKGAGNDHGYWEEDAVTDWARLHMSDFSPSCVASIWPVSINSTYNLCDDATNPPSKAMDKNYDSYCGMIHVVSPPPASEHRLVLKLNDQSNAGEIEEAWIYGAFSMGDGDTIRYGLYGTGSFVAGCYSDIVCNNAESASGYKFTASPLPADVLDWKFGTYSVGVKLETLGGQQCRVHGLCLVVRYRPSLSNLVKKRVFLPGKVFGGWPSGPEGQRPSQARDRYNRYVFTEKSILAKEVGLLAAMEGIYGTPYMPGASDSINVPTAQIHYMITQMGEGSPAVETAASTHGSFVDARDWFIKMGYKTALSMHERQDLRVYVQEMAEQICGSIYPNLSDGRWHVRGNEINSHKTTAVRSNTTAAGVGADYVTLDAGASAVDDTYNDMRIYLGTDDKTFLVYDYVGATKRAYIWPSPDSTPTASQAYTIFDARPDADYRRAFKYSEDILEGSFQVLDMDLTSIKNQVYVDYAYDLASGKYTRRCYVDESGSDDGTGTRDQNGTPGNWWEDREDRATDSQSDFNVKGALNIKLPNIWADDIARFVRDYKFDKYHRPRLPVSFITYLNAYDLKPGHYIEFDSEIDDYIPCPKKGAGGSWDDLVFRVLTVGRVPQTATQEEMIMVVAIETGQV